MVAVLEIGAFSESRRAAPRSTLSISHNLERPPTRWCQVASKPPHPPSRPLEPPLTLPLTVTSLAAATIADRFGRRVTMRTGAILFSIGGCFQTLCTGYGVMVLGRFISGCGVGMLRWVAEAGVEHGGHDARVRWSRRADVLARSMVVPIYQAESEYEVVVLQRCRCCVLCDCCSRGRKEAR